jgi:osmotically-inducible protein OsmY
MTVMKSTLLPLKTALLVCGALVTLTTACSQQEEPPAQPQLTDQSLQELVEKRLQSDANVRRLQITVDADAEHKAVELQGPAFHQRQRTRAVELAQGAAPDINVLDKIEVKPYEIPRELFDDEMMADVKADAGKMGDTVGESIDDAWVHMRVTAKLVAESATPARTINVDVDKGVVTLRGKVPSKESLQQAETVARSVSGVTDVKNRLTVAS